MANFNILSYVGKFFSSKNPFNGENQTIYPSFFFFEREKKERDRNLHKLLSKLNPPFLVS